MDFRKFVSLLIPILLLAVGLALAARYIEYSRLVEFDPIENFIGDFRIVWSSKREEFQRSDIALVAIGEETLRDYSCVSPIPRSILATLINEVDAAAPKAIGIDIIFDRQLPEDKDLIRAISKAMHPIVLGGLDDRYLASNVNQTSLIREELAAQESLVRASGALVGHLWFEHQTGVLNKDDETVRYVAAPNVGYPAMESFSFVLAKAAGFIHRPESRSIAWLLPPKDPTIPLFPQITVRRHKPVDIARGQKLLSPAEVDLLRGRIVIMGADMTDRDRHKVPLSVLDGARLPGVAIHAQAVAQIIDKVRDLRVISDQTKLLLYFFVGFSCLTASAFWRGLYKLRNFGSMFVAVVGLVLLWRPGVDLPVGSVIFVGFVALMFLPTVIFLREKCGRLFLKLKWSV